MSFIFIPKFYIPPLHSLIYIENYGGGKNL